MGASEHAMELSLVQAANLFDTYTGAMANGVVILAVVDGQDAGMAIGGEVSGEDNRAYFQGLFVYPRFRRFKVGEALAINLIRSLKAMGFHTIVADVLVNNKATLTLGRKCGFKMRSVALELEV